MEFDTKEERFEHETQDCTFATENLAYGAAMEEDERKNTKSDKPGRSKSKSSGKGKKKACAKGKNKAEKGKGKSVKDMSERNKRIPSGEGEGKIEKTKKDGRMEGKAGRAGKVRKSGRAGRAGSGKVAKAE